jgi:hypothetical protein
MLCGVRKKMAERRVAIMQPYIFPYIGYFHLIHASNIFVFYDDVNFIKRGWINRNKIINREKDSRFTVPVTKASSNKLINQISPAIDDKWKNKFHKQLIHSYSKAPFFMDVIEPIMSVFSQEYKDITDLAIKSISVVLSHLNLELTYVKSSICSPKTRGIDKADRLIEITKQLGCENYVNSLSGMELYSKEYFQRKGIKITFVRSNQIVYRQYSKLFVPGLSIIDIIMFNDKERTIDFLSEYSLT